MLITLPGSGWSVVVVAVIVVVVVVVIAVQQQPYLGAVLPIPATVPLPLYQSVQYTFLCVQAMLVLGIVSMQIDPDACDCSTLHPSSDTHVLKIQQCKCKAHGFCTFSCFGPHIWN